MKVDEEKMKKDGMYEVEAACLGCAAKLVSQSMLRPVRYCALCVLTYKPPMLFLTRDT